MVNALFLPKQIMTQIDELEDEDLEQGQDGNDLESQLLQERQAREKAEADAQKWKDRFKSTAKKVNEGKDQPNEQVNIDSIVEAKIAERDFYSKNETAVQYQKELKEIQSKTGLSVEDAYALHIAKTKPELLVKKQVSTGVDGYSQPVEEEKDYNNMSDEEFEKHYMTKGRK